MTHYIKRLACMGGMSNVQYDRQAARLSGGSMTSGCLLSLRLSAQQALFTLYIEMTSQAGVPMLKEAGLKGQHITYGAHNI